MQPSAIFLPRVLLLGFGKLLSIKNKCHYRFVVMCAGFHLGPIYRGAEGKSEWSNGGGCKKISSFFLHNFSYIVICT